MSDPINAGAPGSGATPAQLKHDIDSGRTGDKVGGFDPAAAPLGADAEAGGAPAEPRTFASDRVQERSGARNSARANAATPELAPDARAPRQPGMALAAIAGVVVGVGLAALLLVVL